MDKATPPDRKLVAMAKDIETALHQNDANFPPDLPSDIAEIFDKVIRDEVSKNLNGSPSKPPNLTP